MTNPKPLAVVALTILSLLGPGWLAHAADKELKIMNTPQANAADSRLDVKVGDKAPDFTLPMYPGNADFTLSDHLGRDTVVLYFYPGDDTPVCTKQAQLFRDHLADFEAAGAKIYGVSADSLDSHKAFALKYGLPFPLLADTDGRVRELFGMPDGQRDIQGRATYIIDGDGVVRHTILEADDMPRHVTEALDWVQRLATPRTASAGSPQQR